MLTRAGGGSSLFKNLRMSSSSAAAAVAEDTVSAAKANYKIVADVGDFDNIQAQRPKFDHSKPIEVTQSPNPDWKYGQGVPDNGASASKKHTEIDPYAPDRPTVSNYQFLISAIAPRPIDTTALMYGAHLGKVGWSPRACLLNRALYKRPIRC